MTAAANGADVGAPANDLAAEAGGQIANGSLSAAINVGTGCSAGGLLDRTGLEGTPAVVPSAAGGCGTTAARQGTRRRCGS